MKRSITALFLILALLAAFAACRREAREATPTQETSVLTETALETGALDEAWAEAISLPPLDLPLAKEETAAGFGTQPPTLAASAPTQARTAASMKTTGAAPAATTTRTATAAVTTTIKPTATTRPTTTKSGTTSSTTTTTRTSTSSSSTSSTSSSSSSTSSTSSSTSSSSQQAPQPQPTWSVTVTGGGKTQAFTSIDAAKLPTRTLTLTYVNDFGTVTTGVYTGVRLKDVLEACGMTPGAVRVTSADGLTMDYPANLVTADDTLLAWHRNLSEGKTTGPESMLPPRMCPGGSGESVMYLKEVKSITLL